MEYEKYETDEIDTTQEEMEEAAFERQAERQEDYAEGLPSYDKGDLFSLFMKVIDKKDSSKVSNIDKAEMGMLPYTVRDCQRISKLSNRLGHPSFGEFFMELGEITLATSASRRGWLPELFVSQKKFATKARADNLPQYQEVTPAKKKFKIF